MALGLELPGSRGFHSMGHSAQVEGPRFHVQLVSVCRLGRARSQKPDRVDKTGRVKVSPLGNGGVQVVLFVAYSSAKKQM